MLTREHVSAANDQGEDGDALIGTSAGIIAGLSFVTLVLCCMCVAVCQTHKATKRKRRAIHEMEVLRKANKVVPAQEMAKERLAGLVKRQKQAKVGKCPPITETELAELKSMVAAGEITQEEFDAAIGGAGFTLAELEELSKVHKKHHRRRPKAGRARVPVDKGGRLGTNMRWDRVAGHSGLGHGGGGGGSASIVNPTKQAWG